MSPKCPSIQTGDNLLALGRLQGWTLKPAKLRAERVGGRDPVAN